MSELARHVVSLRVGGQSYSQWTEIEIARGIEQASASFTLTLLAPSAYRETDPPPVRPQSACTVTLNGEVLITGYADDCDGSHDASSSSWSVSGRSKTCDLVDCCEPDIPGKWTRATVLQIARDLAAGYGIDVSADAPVGEPLPRFQVELGETCFAAIERAARLRQLLVTDTPTGGLLLTRTGTVKAPGTLLDGGNIKAMSVRLTGSQRYSEYVCKGQRAGDANNTAANVSSVSGTSTDSGTLRRRVLVLQPEGRADAESCRARAEWEALARYGKSTIVTVTMPGWQREDGTVWKVNELVRVVSARYALDATMLIARLTFRRGVNDGTTTVLELQPPEAFTPQPIEARRKGTAKKEYSRYLLSDVEIAIRKNVSQKFGTASKVASVVLKSVTETFR